MSLLSPRPLTLALGILVLATLSAGCGTDEPADGPTLSGKDAPGSNGDGGGKNDGGDASAADAAGKGNDVGASCLTKYDCASKVCDLENQTCVACNFQADCKNAKSRCIKHNCLPLTPCSSDKVCGISDAVCDKDKGVCVDCLNAVDCAVGQICKLAQCVAKPVPCKSSKQCSVNDKVCGGGVCVDCIGDDDCDKAAYCKESTCVPDFCQAGVKVCAKASVIRTCAANGGAYVDAPCPAGKACDNDRCKVIVCKPGAKLCLGDTVAKCDGRGVSTTNVETCGTGELCVDGACLAKSCEPLTGKCGNDEVLTCKANGQGYEAKPCAAAAKKTCTVAQTGADAGKAICVAQTCVPNQAFCVAMAVHVCSADGLSSTLNKTCKSGGANAEVCVNGACVAKACQPGAITCKGLTSRNICKKDGSGYDEKTCPTGKVCESGVCGPKICNPGEKFCAGNVRRMCSTSGGGSVSGEDCSKSQKVCVGGACMAKICVAGQLFCSADGKAVKTCAADGLSASSSSCAVGKVCSAGSCVTQVCEAKKLICQAGKVVQCNAVGSAATVLKSCASGKTCIDGACVSSICGPGTKLCDGINTVMTCNAQGLNWISGVCGAGKVCVSGACKQTICVAGGLLCSGNNVHQCDADGTSSTQLKACGSGLFCVGGACVNTVCKAGSSVCQGEKRATCKADGSGWVASSCGQGQTCANGGCITKTCSTTVKTSGVVAVPVDLITFVDTSGSMGQEAKYFNNHIKWLAKSLSTTNVDWRLIVIANSTGCCKVVPGPTYGGRLVHLNKPVYSLDGLKRLIDYYPSYQTALRAGAKVHFLAVTDDESKFMTAAVFKQKLAQLKKPGFGNGYQFHSIVAYGPMPGRGCKTGARIGYQYLNLTAATGGLKQPVCDANWTSIFSGIFKRMKAQGSVPGKCVYGLPSAVTTYVPAQTGLQVQLLAGGQTQTFTKATAAANCGSALGYYLTAGAQLTPPTQLTLCKYACDAAAGQPLSLTYPCQ